MQDLPRVVIDYIDVTGHVMSNLYGCPHVAMSAHRLTTLKQNALLTKGSKRCCMS